MGLRYLTACLSACFKRVGTWMKVWMDGCIQHDSYIMPIQLSHPHVLLHTTCRWAQSDWQLLFRAILTCMFGTNYTPGTLWHCEVTSHSSLIWWGEQSTLLYSIWCKEYFCVSCVCVLWTCPSCSSHPFDQNMPFFHPSLLVLRISFVSVVWGFFVVL